LLRLVSRAIVFSMRTTALSGFRRVGVVILVAIAGAMVGVSPAAAQACPPDAEVTRGIAPPLATVRYLADDRLAGRLAGSAGERCAGDYIAGEFKRLGLRPSGENGTYFQDVSLASALNPHAPGGTGRNVIAALDGADDLLKREWVVIGAHYDHLGQGHPGSLTPGSTDVHNGADDNASGVAAVLGAAERLTAGRRPSRSVLFIAFTGEESGLLGSSHFLSSPTIAPGVIVAMINLDMIGRLGTGALIVYGVDTAEEWRALVDPAAARAGVTLAVRGEGYGPSDHTSFYLKDVPVLHFFTNTHGDYHKPTDDWDKVDAAGIGKVAAIVADVTSTAANRRPMLTLRRGAGKPPAPPGQLASAGYGAYLGTVPDFAPVDRGVKLSGVTAGSPADKAGLRAGDIVLGIGSHEVSDLQAMTDALRAYKPGDTVAVRFQRDGTIQTMPVTLGSRGAIK
jgi:hypothetical protein